MQATVHDLINMCFFLNGENGKENKNTKLPEGWEIVDKLIDNKSGFMGYAIKKGNGVVVCYKGTDCNSPEDFTSDVAFFFGKRPPQYKQAKDLYLKTKETYGKDHEIIVSGSSLGGGLAEILGTDVCKDKIVNFNPVGINRIKKNGNIKDTNHIFNIVVKTDIVGNLFKHSGNILYVDGPAPILDALSLSKPSNPSSNPKIGLKTRFIDSHLVGNFKNFIPKSILNTSVNNISTLFSLNKLDLITKSQCNLVKPNVLEKPKLNPLLQVYKYSFASMKI